MRKPEIGSGGFGSSLKNVLKTTVYLGKMSDFAAMNEVYAKYFGEAAPARSTVEAAGLPKTRWCLLM